MRITMILLGVLIIAGAARAQQFDIEAYCRTVADTVGGSYQIEKACRQQEATAQAQLGRMEIEDRIWNYCTDVSDAVGGSYQIMRACVDQELRAKRGM